MNEATSNILLNISFSIDPVIAMRQLGQTRVSRCWEVPFMDEAASSDQGVPSVYGAG